MENSTNPKKTTQKSKTDGQLRYEVRRKQLIDLSIEARRHRAEMVQKCMSEGYPQAAELWALTRVNDIIAESYREKTGAKVFKTFWQWKQEGLSVKKGEKAFLLWGKK